MGKELEGLKEGPKAKIYIDSLRAAHKKYQIGKVQAMMAYILIKKFTSINDR